MAVSDRGVNFPRRLDRSIEWRVRAERVVPNGAQTFSKSPMSFVQGIAPNFLRKAKGAYVWDVDGNRYIDYVMGLGPPILGHADPVVNAAAREQMEEGISFSLPHPVEVEVAELLCELIPCAEMVRFGKNGSDATAAAVRVARAYTHRDKVACCGYHGWQDWYIGSTNRHQGVPAVVRSLTLRFPYNDLGALHRLFRENRDEIACVVMEPVAFDVPLPGYLEGVKELCHHHKALLVFDEVVTGCRVAIGGAQEHFGVVPDLACFGKAIANGFPLSAIVGTDRVMRLFEEVFFSTTHGGETVSLVACRTTIGELRRRRGIEQLWRAGGRLKDGTNTVVEKLNLGESIQCVGLAPLTALRFSVKSERESLLLRSLFQQEALKRGILTQGNHMLSLAHEEEIVEETLEVYGEVFRLLAEALEQGEVEKRLAGPCIRPILRQV